MRTALEQAWQRRQALEREVEELRAEVAALRETAVDAPAALAVERELLRRQIDDLLTVKLRMADELRGVLDIVDNGGSDVGAQRHIETGGRAYGDLDAVLDGSVVLVAEPLGDFDAIAALERAIGGVAQVRDVRVRTADGTRVSFELDLRARGPLLRSLDGELPFDADAAIEDGVVVLRPRGGR